MAMLLYFLGMAASAAIGLSLGFLGGGGSIITLPVLVYLLGIPVHEAIGMSLLVVGATSATGAYLHHRRGGHLDLQTGLIFGTAGLGGAYFGSRVSVLVPEQLLLILFAILMLVVSVATLLRRNIEPMADSAPAWKTLTAGIFIGFLTGFLGVGGGFLIVPALVLWAGLNTRTAIGTSLLIISMNCAAGFVGHLHSSSLNLDLTFLITALSFAGLVAGTILSKGTSPARLKHSFALFVLAVGVTMLVLNI